MDWSEKHTKAELLPEGSFKSFILGDVTNEIESDQGLIKSTCDSETIQGKKLSNQIKSCVQSLLGCTQEI